MSTSLPRPALPARARAFALLVLTLAIALGGPTAASAAPSAAAVSAEVALALEAAVARADRAVGTLGMAVAVVADDGRTWVGSHGIDEGGRRIDAAAPFVIGSVTKTFTAALVMALVDEGRIALDAPVATYLPNVRMARGVTVRQLLTHTSGIADLYGSRKWHLHNRPHQALTSNDVLFSIGARWFAPGTGYAYSNTNYFLLGHIIEAVSHRTFAEELERRFTGPMGLENTRLLGPESPLLPAAWSTGFWTSGAMQSTPLELASWGRNLFGGHALSYPSTRRMVTDKSGTRYGHGTQLFRIAGRDLPGHSGLLYSTTTLMVHLPAERVTVVLTGPQPGVDLESALAGQYGGPSLLEVARQLAG
ncbi:MAG TPA: serine hydrolase domain-containing protein [Candidatus Limnocylindria bacterium]